MAAHPLTHDPRWSGFGFLAVTAIGWAINWPAIKLLLREWPPLFGRGVSGVAAGLILAGIALLLGQSLKVPRGAWAALALGAFTNVFAWMGFATMAMQYLSISECALLVYTMPIWATLFAWPVQGARPTLRDIAALLLGIGGIVVLFGGHGLALGTEKLLGVLLALASATLFALGGVMRKTPLPLEPVAAVAWQVGLGCAPMLPLGLLFESHQIGALSPAGWGVVLYMTLGPMGLCYLSWFAALRRLPAKTAAIGTLTVPVMGVTFGALALGDPVGAREAIAAALTLGGVALALQRPPAA